MRYNDHSPRLADEHAPTLNIEKIDRPEKDAIIEMISGDELHIGYCIDEKTFIHTTRAHGVRVSRIGALPIRNCYRII